MAAPYLPWPAGNPETAERIFYLFLDSEPEVKYPATRTCGSGSALDGTPKQCYNAVNTTVKTSLFFSSSPSVRRSEHCFGCRQGWRTLPKANISAIFKVPMEPFSQLHFFIGYFTLPTFSAILAAAVHSVNVVVQFLQV